MIAGIGTGSSGTSQTGQASATLAQNLDTFLKLLTTQLQNQDPLDPLDSAEFSQQLAQFSAVEQQIATNRNLEQMLELFQAGQSAAVAGYLGKTVEAKGDVAALSGGSATWSYALPGAASTVRLSILDANGKVVRTLDGETGQGAHALAWDGRTNAGQRLPDGFYRLTVEAVDAAGLPLEARTNISGIVTGIETVDGRHVLRIGEARVPLGDVTAIQLAATPN